MNKSINKYGLNLGKIVEQNDEIQKVLKCSLDFGDYVFVKTHNSVYSICKRKDGLFEIRGGWFDRKGLSPAVLSIRGCTWGGSIINLGVVAARGLFLEFGNNLTTSPIRKIVVIKAKQLN
jgi:hypothetical protein